MVQLSTIHSASLVPGGTPSSTLEMNSLKLANSVLFSSLNAKLMGAMDAGDGAGATADVAGDDAGAGAGAFAVDMLSEQASTQAERGT